MICPRLDHFVKLHPLNQGGVLKLCCHMTNPPSFMNYDQMMNSQWRQDIKTKFANDEFPDECIRCKQSEDIGQLSIRHHAISYHESQSKEDYIVCDVMLDNICNSACQFCSPMASTKFGSLISKNYRIHDNTNHFNNLPLDRITQIDLAGGEPSNSKNIKALLSNLPPNVSSIRVNTNCSSFMSELIPFLDKGIKLAITISMDGVGEVHNYVRWPIHWDSFEQTVLQYKQFAFENSDLVSVDMWTTVNTLNVNNLDKIFTFSENLSISNSFSILIEPKQLNIRYKNELTLATKEKYKNSPHPFIQSILSTVAVDDNNQQEFDKFVAYQDSLRKISIKDYNLLG